MNNFLTLFRKISIEIQKEVVEMHQSFQSAQIGWSSFEQNTRELFYKLTMSPSQMTNERKSFAGSPRLNLLPVTTRRVKNTRRKLVAGSFVLHSSYNGRPNPLNFFGSMASVSSSFHLKGVCLLLMPRHIAGCGKTILWYCNPLKGITSRGKR